MQGEWDRRADERIGLVLVGFSPADRLAAIARQVGWRGVVLGDEPRELYRRLDVRRAPLWRVYSPGTLLTYARGVRQVRRPSGPLEDTRQLGADAVVVGGVVVALWRPRTPNDRPPAVDVLSVALRRLSPGAR